MHFFNPHSRPITVLPALGLLVIALAVCATAMTGCGPPPEVPPGTAGIVRTDSVPLTDVLVQIYSDPPAPQPLGAGITDSSGRFQLRLPDLSAPLHVEPGDYRLTIESAGDIPLSWPAQLRDPQKTPLRQTVTDPQQAIELDFPTPR